MDAEAPAAQRPLRVLFVCMGNLCRSPMVEAVFRALAAQHAPTLAIEVDSAGTHDYHVGRAPDPRAQQVALARGLDLSTRRARRLQREDFERFDWIIVMDERNYQAALALAPPARRERVRLLLDWLPKHRLREVPDPYYGSLSDFERVYELAEQASRALLEALVGSGPSG